MRPLSLAALFALASFALGLAAGGGLPEEADAADAPSTVPGIHWMNDGETLTLANQEEGAGYVALGRLEAGAQAPPLPPPTASSVKLPTADFRTVTVYRIEAVLSCDSRDCRRCQPGVVGCPAPPPIPIAADEHQVNIAQKPGSTFEPR